jgi:uncharacterized membrane-anchored protein
MQHFHSQAADCNHSLDNDDVVPKHQPSDPDDVLEGEEEDYGYQIVSDSEAEDGDSEDGDMGARMEKSLGRWTTFKPKDSMTCN